MRTVDARVLRELRDVVGDAHILQDDDVTQRYRTDWTGRFHTPSATIVRPGSALEMAEVVGACARSRTAIVPQGGNTGLVGGGVPLSGEVVVSTERLASIEDVNAHAGHLTAGAGASLASVQLAASEHGWEYAVDIASRETATIGGTVATNAGGLRAIRYGDTRRQVLGLEVVTGSGEVISSLAGTLRDNTGYHLPSMICGSEGTLGVITHVRLRLVPHLTRRTTALLRFADERHAVLAAEALRRHLPSMQSVEVFFAHGLKLVCEVFALAAPFPNVDGGYVLAEVAGSSDPTAELGTAVESLDGVSDVAVAIDSVRRAALWRFRELHTEAISTIGVPHKLDVALPPGMLSAFVAEVPRVVEQAAPGSRTWLFGHGGESSVHVNVTGPSDDDYAVDEAVMEFVSELNGSISAEHGIGRAKLPWIHLARGAEELRVLSNVKAAFDPSRILNPSVLLPSTS